MILTIILAFAVPAITALENPYTRKLTVGTVTTYPWPSSNVNYELPANGVFKKGSLQDWNKIFQNVEENTCINIKERKGQAGFLKIGRDNGTDNRVENLGYAGEKEHRLWILLDNPNRPGYTSAFYDTMKHEFMHALGLDHDEFNVNLGGNSGPYDWDKAYRTLRTMYKCNGTYPRVIAKRPGTTNCEDKDPDGCDQAISAKGKDWACTGDMESRAKAYCEKTCNLCGKTVAPPCRDTTGGCMDAIAKNGKGWACSDPQAWYSDKCNKSCGKC